MEHVGTYAEKIRAIADRCKAREDDPEFRRQAERSAAEDAEALKRSNEAERARALQAAGIPMRFWEEMRAPRDTAALTAAREFLAAPPACAFLTLVGPRGRGKSFAASWVIGRLGGLYVPAAQDLVFAGAFAPIWQDMEAASALSIDELGTEYLNDAYSASLYALLNRRYLQQRRTVLVSNLDAEQLRQRLLASGLERLIERMQTGGIFRTLPGESMRKHWSQP